MAYKFFLIYILSFDKMIATLNTYKNNVKGNNNAQSYLSI